VTNKPVKRKSSGLRVFDGALLVAAGVIGVVVAFAALHFVVGVVWELVKIAVIVVVVAALFWILGRRRRR
jgi:hypothetical protein